MIGSARRVLIAEGSSGFSMRTVAQHLGMSLGNLQYHFPTRKAVLDGLLAADALGGVFVLQRERVHTITVHRKGNVASGLGAISDQRHPSGPRHDLKFPKEQQ